MKTFKIAFFALLFMMTGVVSAASLSVTSTDATLSSYIEDSPSDSVSIVTTKLSGDFTHEYNLSNTGLNSFRMHINGNVEKTTNFTSLLVEVRTMADVLVSSLTVVPGTTGSSSFGIYSDIILGATDAYKLLFIGTGFNGAKYSATLETPIPAAVWLFGSALMGLVGVSRRKSTAVAA